MIRASPRATDHRIIQQYRKANSLDSVACTGYAPGAGARELGEWEGQGLFLPP